MKYNSFARKTSRQTKTDRTQESSAGKNGISLTPPKYGLDFIDREPASAGPLRVDRPSLSQQQPPIQQQAYSEPVQLDGGSDVSTDKIHKAARQGIRTPSSTFPYAKEIQKSFGRHDISGINFHNSSEAAQSARAMNARAYSTAGHVVSAGPISKHTAAHEAAHYIQQQAGVQLKNNVGTVGDKYERHADAVASAVVRGTSAEALLDRPVGPGAHVALKPDTRGPTSSTADVQMERPEVDDKHEGLTMIAQSVGGPHGESYTGHVYLRDYSGFTPSPAMVLRGLSGRVLSKSLQADYGDILVLPSALDKVTQTDAVARGVMAHEAAHYTLDRGDHPVALYEHELSSAVPDNDETELKAYLNAQVGTISNYEIMKTQVRGDGSDELKQRIKDIVES